MSIKLIFPDNLKSFIFDTSDKFSILILRLFIGFMWFSMGLIKVIERNPDPFADHNWFLFELTDMAVKHPYQFASDLINNILIANVEIFVWLTIFTEFFIGITITLGLFSRLGSLTGMIMTFMLWFMTLGWDEWFFTYPLIFMPMLVIFLSNTSHDIGIDKILKEKLLLTKFKYLV